MGNSFFVGYIFHLCGECILKMAQEFFFWWGEFFFNVKNEEKKTENQKNRSLGKCNIFHSWDY